MIAQSGKGARKTSSTCLSCGFKQIYHVSNAEEGCWGAVPRGSEHAGELTWWINQAVLVKALGVEGRAILTRCSWTSGRVPMAICGRYDSFWENTPILLKCFSERNALSRVCVGILEPGSMYALTSFKDWAARLSMNPLSVFYFLYYFLLSCLLLVSWSTNIYFP